MMVAMRMVRKMMVAMRVVKIPKRWQVAIKSFLVLRIYNAGIRSKTIKRGVVVVVVVVVVVFVVVVVAVMNYFGKCCQI